MLKQLVPEAQSQAFNVALCERLGLDPAIVSGRDFRANLTVVAGEDLGEVNLSFKVYLPAEDLMAMFNGAGRP